MGSFNTQTSLCWFVFFTLCCCSAPSEGSPMHKCCLPAPQAFLRGGRGGGHRLQPTEPAEGNGFPGELIVSHTQLRALESELADAVSRCPSATLVVLWLEKSQDCGAQVQHLCLLERRLQCHALHHVRGGHVLI